MTIFKGHVSPHAPLYLESVGSRGIVVFIHGFMGSPRQFDDLALAAQKHGLSAASLLLPGHGGTAKDFSKGTFQRWQGHVDSEVERFTQDCRDIWLVGHSMGGLLAICSAIKHSVHVRGVFPIACPFEVKGLSKSSLKARMKQLFVKEVKSAYFNDSSVPVVPSLLWNTMKPAEELRKLTRAARESLPDVRVPVMAVYSASDELTAISSLEVFKSELTGAPFGHLLLSDSMHAYYPEHERAVIARALLDFILLTKGH